jgi:predicted amidophosphoribosyltransferase
MASENASRSAQTIVDFHEVHTTGATAAEAARALRRAGTRRVDVVTFARAIRTD